MRPLVNHRAVSRGDVDGQCLCSKIVEPRITAVATEFPVVVIAARGDDHEDPVIRKTFEKRRMESVFIDAEVLEITIDVFFWKVAEDGNLSLFVTP
jgi:hypothetical protein